MIINQYIAVIESRDVPALFPSLNFRQFPAEFDLRNTTRG